MPPAFVLSQDQTLRLTSDLPPQNQPKPANQPRPPQDRTPKIGIPLLLNALSSRRTRPRKIPRSLQKPAQAQSIASRNTQSNRSSEPATADPRPPPAHPFSNKLQCQTATFFRPRTRKTPSPDRGLGDPSRPVGACRQSKERCNTFARARRSGRLPSHDGGRDYLVPGMPTVQSKTPPATAKQQKSVDYSSPRARNSDASFSGNSSER
jgi:hypothetical protein